MQHAREKLRILPSPVPTSTAPAANSRRYLPGLARPAVLVHLGVVDVQGTPAEVTAVESRARRVRTIGFHLDEAEPAWTPGLAVTDQLHRVYGTVAAEEFEELVLRRTEG